MTCKEKGEITSFLIVATVYFYTFQLCGSVSLGPRRGHGSTAGGWERVTGQGGGNPAEHVVHLRKFSRRGLPEPWPEPAGFTAETTAHFNGPNRGDADSGFVWGGWFWTFGNVSTLGMSWPPQPEDGYQRDSTGFHGVQGKVLGPSSDSSPSLSEWLAMSPMVQCDHKVMTFTASGEGTAQLLVDRAGGSPIPPSQLTPHCGYLVRTSWSDLAMMMSYDACYVIQENGNHVLPMLWWGIPLKLSCPIQTTTPAPSHTAPAVFCSSYGMVVQVIGQEQDIHMLGTIVKGSWAPFVSAECAYHVSTQPQGLLFYIFLSAPCVTVRDTMDLQLILDKQTYILSCPVMPQFLPHPPGSPGEPELPYVPDPAPTPPPLTQEQIFDYLRLSYQDYYSQLPQIYPPGSQPVHPPQPTAGSPPGPQPQQSVYLSGSGKVPSSSGEHPSPQAPSELPADPSQYPYGLYYHYYYTAVTPAPTPAPKPPPTSPPPTQQTKSPIDLFYQQYSLQKPHYPAPTVAPVTGDKTPPDGQDDFNYYPYNIFNVKPGFDVQSPYMSLPVPTPPPVAPSYPYDHFYSYWPIYILPPTTLPAKETSQPPPPEPQQPVVQQTTCPPDSQTYCSYYPYPHYPYYHTPYPPVPTYPTIQPPVKTPTAMTQTTTTTATTPTSTTATTPTTTTTTTTAKTPATATSTLPTPQSPVLRCLMRRLEVFLPSAHPDSIQVRDQKKTWLFLSSVSSQCEYKIQKVDSSGVIFSAPLPACHSQLRAVSTVSLPLRFFDLSIGKHRTLDLQCPYTTKPDIPPPVTPSFPPTPPSTRGPIRHPAEPKPKVVCSHNHMTVELPPGPISGIVVKDSKGNQIAVRDAQNYCGYSASKGKDGKIRLSIQLHSSCMSVKGKMYTIAVVYATVYGRTETDFSCPVSISWPKKECDLTSEQRLPCGPRSVSQPQCLSMGCCFSKHPPSCHYPMDECTIDRHFVFSVPAALTEPPLSPGLLVTAGNSACKPQKVTSDYAFFKVPMDGCGARRMEVGKTVIYMLEVINKVQAISLNYGTITRDSPVRLLVECRYMPGSLLTVSYLVKTPSLGPAVQTQGAFGVQLRIAKDAMYSSYYPQYHQPLQMLLGKPLYLEVRLLNAPDPSLVLLVHYCVAYPRSGKAVWVVLYNGCPNPLDPAPQQAVLLDPQPPSPQGQTRRFTISTFQFLPDGEFKDINEEVYFMCSTEICSPRDGPCVEGCFTKPPLQEARRLKLR